MITFRDSNSGCSLVSYVLLTVLHSQLGTGRLTAYASDAEFEEPASVTASVIMPIMHRWQQMNLTANMMHCQATKMPVKLWQS